MGCVSKGVSLAFEAAFEVWKRREVVCGGMQCAQRRQGDARCWVRKGDAALEDSVREARKRRAAEGRRERMFGDRARIYRYATRVL